MITRLTRVIQSRKVARDHLTVGTARTRPEHTR